MTVSTRTEVEAVLAERIAADPAFRDALLADPRGVISGIVGFDIPESVQVVVHEESLTQIHLTIPSSDHLADDDLQFVAGGARWSNSCGAYSGDLPPTIA